MLELIVTLVITASSVALFGYWFRYTCLLILSAKTTRDYAAEIAAANQLSFLQVQAQLRENSPDLDRLQAALDRDLVMITYLIQHASGNREWGVEDRMLKLNYRLMSASCSLSRRVSPEAGRRALDEMSMIISHFANAMGERSMAGAAASLLGFRYSFAGTCHFPLCHSRLKFSPRYTRRTSGSFPSWSGVPERKIRPSLMM